MVINETKIFPTAHNPLLLSSLWDLASSFGFQFSTTGLLITFPSIFSQANLLFPSPLPLPTNPGFSTPVPEIDLPHLPFCYGSRYKRDSATALVSVMTFAF